MTDSIKKYGRWALVAGAGSGIGAAYCHELASRGFHVFMIDKNLERLKLLQSKFESENQNQTDYLHLDLGAPNLETHLHPVLDRYDFGLMIYNAAYGPVRKFDFNTIDQLNEHINVNCRGPLIFASLFQKSVKSKERLGGMIIMTSLAALQGAPLIAPYAATKAFDLVLGESLYHELKKDGINVLTCIAGATKTENYIKTKPDYGILKPSEHEPQRVAREALSQIGKKPYHIVGRRNRLTAFIFQRILGRKLASTIMSSQMKSIYKAQWNQ